MTKEMKKVKCSDGRGCKGKGFCEVPKDWKSDVPVICSKCQNRSGKYGPPMMNVVKSKLKAIKTTGELSGKEEKNLYTIRELVQNADDTKARIVTIRLDKDTLFVGNDGHGFRPPMEIKGVPVMGDLERMCEVLSGAKAAEAMKAGEHGSGFVSVFWFTNRPTIHSYGISVSLDPINNSMEPLEVESVPKKRSPFSDDGTFLHYGTLFVLPLRRKLNESGPFSERDWPTWGKKSDRTHLYEVLKKNLHDLILCCQHLESIRLISDDLNESYQVSRKGFKLNEEPTKPYEASIEEGLVSIKHDWEEAFTVEGAKWSKRNRPDAEWRYLIGSGHVTNEDGERLFFGEFEPENFIVTTDIDDIMEKYEMDEECKFQMVKAIKKRENIYVLMPLFDTKERGPQNYHKYSVLPLPLRSENRFACSAHLEVDEGRRSIRLGDSEEWAMRAMLSLKDLYLRLFDEYLDRIWSLEGPKGDLSCDVKQRLVLNALPAEPLCNWIDTEKKLKGVLEGRDEEIIDEMLKKRILYIDEEPISPLEAHWLHKGDIDFKKMPALLERLGGHLFTEEFTSHDMFHVIEEVLKERRFNQDAFKRIWGNFVENNTDEDDPYLELDQELDDGTDLDEDLVRSLITYCHEDKRSDEIKALEVIPDDESVLKAKKDLLLVPKYYGELYELIKEDRRVHQDFKKQVTKIYNEISEPNEIIEILSTAVNEQTKRFDPLDKKDHMVISDLVKRTVTHKNFALDGVKDHLFIPFRYRGELYLGSPNKDLNGDIMNKVGKQAQNYRRDFIWATERKKVPGLTKEVRRGIRILDLDIDDGKVIKKIESKLLLEELYEETAANFVRIYISPKHGSLFDKEILKNYLKEDAKVQIKDEKKMMKDQRRALLRIVKDYFNPDVVGEGGFTKQEDMKKVPCVFDSQGNWWRPDEMVIESDPIVKRLGLPVPDRYFRTPEWKEILEKRLGVHPYPDIDVIVNNILKFRKGHNLKALKEVLIYLLQSNIKLEIKDKVFFKDLPEIKELKWVPTQEGFAEAERSYYPNEVNLEIMGEDYGKFIDLPKKTFKELSKRPDLNKRLMDLGIQTGLDLTDKLKRISDLYEDDEPPSPMLFDDICRKDVPPNYKQGAIYQGEDSPYTYYSNIIKPDGKGIWGWVKAKEIMLTNSHNIPEQLRSHYLVLSSDCDHVRYLRFFLELKPDGFSYSEILDLMGEGKIDIDLNLWSFLSGLDDDVKEDDSLVQFFEDIPLFPNPENEDQLICPNRIIFLDKGYLPHKGWLGKWYVLQEDRTIRTTGIIAKLKVLGAKHVHDLDARTLEDILDDLSWSGVKDYDPHIYGSIRRLVLLLAEMAHEDDRLRFDEINVPVRSGPDTMYSEYISSCYINDHFKAPLFRNKLSILDTTIDGKHNHLLHDFFIKNRAGSIAEEINKNKRIIKKPEGSTGEEDELQSVRLREIGNALGIYLSKLSKDDSTINDLEGSIKWLKDCCVKRYHYIRTEYVIGEADAHSDGYEIEDVDDGYCINLVRRGPIGMINELALEIYDTCMSRGAPIEERTPISSVISNLLLSDLESWGSFVAGYDCDIPFEELPPDIFDEFLDETTENYNETKSALYGHYKACQICLERTPKSDQSVEDSCETVSSIVSRRGGRYRGSHGRYTTGNSLFLCPRHQALFKRRLIMIPYLETANNVGKDEAIKMIEDKKATMNLRLDRGEYDDDRFHKELWRMYDTPTWERGEGDDEPRQIDGEWDWRNKVIHFEPHHLIKLLDWVSEHLEKGDTL